MKVVVLGGNGALGSSLVAKVLSNNNWVASIDLTLNSTATLSSQLPPQDLNQQLAHVVNALQPHAPVDAIYCVAGGWQGGNAKDEKFIDSVVRSWNQSGISSVLAVALAARILKKNGLLVLTGALAAINPTPGMIGYGMVKASVHHLVKSLAAESSGLEGITVVGICPSMLDTKANRNAMPGSDYSSWTPLDDLSSELLKWINLPPENASLIEVKTSNGVTRYLKIEK